MQHDLIDRYIYAVSRHLPGKIRADVEKELDSLITDMLEARCGETTPQEQDIRVVLTELGNPNELAEKYNTNGQKALISGGYFVLYKKILQLVIPICAAATAFAGVLGMVMSNEPPVQSVWITIAEIIGQVIGGSVMAFSIITIIFAVFDYKRVDITDGDVLANLPLIPQKNERIKPAESIAGIIWSVFAALLFIGFPQVVGGWTAETGWIPIFNTTVIRSFWLPIVLWGVLGVIKEITKLIEGRYTKKLAVVTLAANIVTLVATAVVWFNSAIMNPAFSKNIVLLLEEPDGWITRVFADFNLYFFAVICFALILETAINAFKAFKYDR